MTDDLTHVSSVALKSFKHSRRTILAGTVRQALPAAHAEEVVPYVDWMRAQLENL